MGQASPGGKILIGSMATGAIGFPDDPTAYPRCGKRDVPNSKAVNKIVNALYSAHTRLINWFS